MRLDYLKKLVASGEFTRALEIASEIETHDRYFFYEKAKAYLGLRNYRAAVSEIDSVLLLKPDWLGAHSIKISALIAEKDEAGVGDSLRRMIADSVVVSDRVDVFKSLFNQILDSELEKKFYTLSASLEYYRYMCGEDNLYYFFSGVVDSNLGYLESAAKKFGLINGDNIGELGRHATGALSFKYGWELDSVAHALSGYKQKIQLLNHTLKLPVGSESVVFAACDSKYFDMFGDVLISSIAGKLEKKVCHVHVVNPTDAVFEKASRFDQLMDNFNFSYEFSGFTSSIYYAVARFVALEQILELYGLDVLVCDVDAAFLSNYSLDEILSTRDIVIKADDKCSLHTYPWRGLAAGFFAVRNGAAAVRFVRALKSYVMHFMLDSKYDKIWYFDQTALFCLINYFSAGKDEVSVGFVYGETSRVIVYPDAKKETKEEFASRLGVLSLLS
ncbi:hypothetical protein ACF8LD_17645 [Pseudomonas sp. zbq_5]|uniref:hypothetical protein n=1 Tax=unclassified Pseudomonas TaxID=196821 RepID=UPI00370A592F